MRIRVIIAILTVALAATGLWARHARQQGSEPPTARAGSGPPANIGTLPAVPSLRDSRFGAVDSPLGLAAESSASGPALTHIELGDMDARPWVYRDELERQAALKAARESVSTGSSASIKASASGSAAVSIATPVVGDGPLGPAATQYRSGLPGPGETMVGTDRVGPSAPPPDVAGKPPEHGVPSRASEGPARPPGIDDAPPGPLRPSDSPEVSGSGG